MKLRTAAFGLALVAATPAMAQQQQTAPASQAFVGSPQMLLKAYGALEVQIIDLRKQVAAWKAYAKPLYTAPKAAPKAAIH